MSAVRQYELIYITPPDATEEALNELHGQVLAVVERFQGTIEKTENWGRRRLAYEIAGHREGVYVLELINGPAPLLAELDRRLRVFDIVLRHMVVRVDEELAAGAQPPHGIHLGAPRPARLAARTDRNRTEAAERRGRRQRGRARVRPGR